MEPVCRLTLAPAIHKPADLHPYGALTRDRRVHGHGWHVPETKVSGSHATASPPMTASAATIPLDAARWRVVQLLVPGTESPTRGSCPTASLFQQRASPPAVSIRPDQRSCP